jgi:tetratricopeptide (TPR) repeat protein
MPSKKKSKPKHIRQATPPELIASAEELLRRGQVDEAIHDLRLAEKELRPRVTAEGTKLPSLLARALAARAATTADRKQAITDLEEATKIAPQETRYRVALGAARLLAGEAAAAHLEFEKAEESRPGDELATRAFALGLLSTGHDREVKALLDRTPENLRDQSWRRLAAIQSLSDGGVQTNDQLFDGLSHLARGENERANEALAALPTFDRNPTGVEAARIATQFFYRGAIKFNARNYQAAIADWREANRLLQTHQLSLSWRQRLPIYYHKIAETIWRDDLQLAIQCWQEAIKISPDDQTAQVNLKEAKRARASEAWRQGRIEEAADLWLDLSQASPSDERLLKNLAIANERLKRKGEALTHWQALVRLWRSQAKQRAAEPDLKERLLKLEQRVVDLMIETGADEQAVVNELEAALRFDPENYDLRMQAAHQLLEIGRPNPALKHLETIERQRGVSAQTLVNKAIAFDMLERHKDAQKVFEQAMEIDPSNAITRRNYLVFLTQEATRAEESGNHKRAVEIFQKQLTLDDHYEPALASLAARHLRAKRKAEAKELLDRIIAKDPKSPQKRVIVGTVYLSAKLHKEAEAAFKEAVKLQPDAECYFNIGVAYNKFNETKQAVKYFDKAAETADIDLLLGIAVELAEQGHIKEANRYLEKMSKLDPSHPMPYLVRALSRVADPLSLIFSKGVLLEVLKDLAEADRLMTGNEEYRTLQDEIRQVRQELENPPPEIRALMRGGLPSIFDDDDDDDFFDQSGTTRRRKSRR